MWPQACDRDASRPQGKVFRADRTGRRPQGGPITSWRDSLCPLGWECPEVLQEGLLGGGPAAIITNTNPLSGGETGDGPGRTYLPSLWSVFEFG